jgi:phospholipid/cholesterol/gamma-HCH transport system substrate-binding protein
MEKRRSYILVGIFVILLTIGATLFALWLGNIGQQRKTYAYYYTFIAESVSGLPRDGAVKYMGVDIGKVKEITIDPKDTTKVRLLLQIPEDFPIQDGMVAQLGITGITGIAYIEIIGGKPGKKILHLKNLPYPVIPSQPSIFARLGTSVPDLAVKVAETFSRINDTLDDHTIADIKGTFEHLNDATARLDRLLADDNLQAIHTTLQEVASASRRLHELFATNDALRQAIATLDREGVDTLRKIGRSADALRHLSENLDTRIERGDYDPRRLLRGTLSSLESLIAETKTLVYLLQEDALMLKESPSDLLFKSAEPTLGPGERHE